MRFYASTMMLALGFIVPSVTFAERFTFLALGDMPYQPYRDKLRFDRLIDKVKSSAPAFIVHVGDTKSGSTPCDNAQFEKILDDLNRFQAPLVYTPGDNEPRHCYKKKAGRYNPLERLAELRKMFFSRAKNFDKKSSPIERQANVMPDYSDVVDINAL